MKPNKPNLDELFKKAAEEQPVLSRDDARRLVEEADAPQSKPNFVTKLTGKKAMTIAATISAAAATGLIMMTTLRPDPATTNQQQSKDEFTRFEPKIEQSLPDNDLGQELTAPRPEKQYIASNDLNMEKEESENIEPLKLTTEDIRGVKVIELNEQQLRKLGIYLDKKENELKLFNDIKSGVLSHTFNPDVTTKEHMFHKGKTLQDALAEIGEAPDSPPTLMPTFLTDRKGWRQISTFDDDDHTVLVDKMVQTTDMPGMVSVEFDYPGDNTGFHRKMNYNVQQILADDTAAEDDVNAVFMSMSGNPKGPVKIDTLNVPGRQLIIRRVNVISDTVKTEDEEAFEFHFDDEDLFAPDSLLGPDFRKRIDSIVKNAMKLRQIGDSIRFEFRTKFIPKMEEFKMQWEQYGDSLSDHYKEFFRQHKFEFKFDSTRNDVDDEKIYKLRNVLNDKVRKYHSDEPNRDFKFKKMILSKIDVKEGNPKDITNLDSIDDEIKSILTTHLGEMREQNWTDYIKVNNLLPVGIKFNKNSRNYDYIFWYHPDDILDKLPEDIRREVKSELATLEKGDVCEAAAIAGEDTYLDAFRACSGAIEKLQSYPNPTSGSISLSYLLKEKRQTEISLHDLYGNKLRLLKPMSVQNAGDQEFNFMLDNLESGMYLIVVSTDRGEQTVQRIILEK